MLQEEQNKIMILAALVKKGQRTQANIKRNSQYYATKYENYFARQVYFFRRARQIHFHKMACRNIFTNVYNVIC